MSIESRINRVESRIGEETEKSTIIVVNSDEEEQEKIKELKKIYGENYSPVIVILKSDKTEEERKT